MCWPPSGSAVSYAPVRDGSLTINVGGESGRGCCSSVCGCCAGCCGFYCKESIIKPLAKITMVLIGIGIILLALHLTGYI